MSDWTDLWHAVTTAALLGTERRDVPDPFVPPDAPPMVVAVGDAVLDIETHRPVRSGGGPDPARRAVRLLAAGTVAQRAGLKPGPVLEPSAVPVRDPRLAAGERAVAIWRRILEQWPVLDEEFVVRVLESGRRLPPDLVPTMLQRWRGTPLAHARVCAAAGPIAAWLISLSPPLAGRGRVAADVDLSALPVLAMTESLTAAVDALADPERDARPLVRLLGNAAFADRIVVTNAVRSLSPGALEALLAALEPQRGDPLVRGLMPAAAELATLRLELSRELPRGAAPIPTLPDQKGSTE